MAENNIVQVVRSLTSTIRADCSDIDETRAVPKPVIEKLRSAGVFRMLAPREIGGAETDPLAFFDVVEGAAAADGSVGWVAMIGGCYATFGGLLSPAGAAEIFGDPSTITAGAFWPPWPSRWTVATVSLAAGRSAAVQAMRTGSSPDASSCVTESRCRRRAAHR